MSFDQLSVFSVVASPEVFQSHLAVSLARLPDEVEVVTVVGERETCVATEYNRFLDAAPRRYVLFAHPDVEFRPDWLRRYFRWSKPTWGVAGVVGALKGRPATGDQAVLPLWATEIRCATTAETLDSCCLLIDTSHGLRFDDEVFDGQHLYGEDMCYQEQAQGRENVIVPSRDVAHRSGVEGKPASWFSDYRKYRKRLVQKWPGFSVLTT